MSYGMHERAVVDNRTDRNDRSVKRVRVRFA
jgi:hypothetical protein